MLRMRRFIKCSITVLQDKFRENIECISIEDNVFIGTNSIILPNVMIGPNTYSRCGNFSQQKY